jgi:hypothetical protein
LTASASCCSAGEAAKSYPDHRKRDANTKEFFARSPAGRGKTLQGWEQYAEKSAALKRATEGFQTAYHDKEQFPNRPSHEIPRHLGLPMTYFVIVIVLVLVIDLPPLRFDYEHEHEKHGWAFALTVDLSLERG